MFKKRMELPICFLLITVSFAAATDSLHPLSDEFISLINSKQNSWTAGRNFAPDIPLSYIKNLNGARKDPTAPKLPAKTHDERLIASLPDNFDPREKWPECQSLNEIRDQGGCGSCWAFAAVEAMTDRVCTYSNGKLNFEFSAQDLVSCCHDCGNCDGGLPATAWAYWRDEGIVSGGPFRSYQGCRPYEFEPCDHMGGGPYSLCKDAKTTPKCRRKCVARYGNYKKDKRNSTHVYSVYGEEHIKAELYANGPVDASIDVFADFGHYKSGVYQHVAGKMIGGHCVKILGWGVENGIKYWLCANSWSTYWGDNGFFKILRGENHCAIESEILAGEPNLEGLTD